MYCMYVRIYACATIYIYVNVYVYKKNECVHIQMSEYILHMFVFAYLLSLAFGGSIAQMQLLFTFYLSFRKDNIRFDKHMLTKLCSRACVSKIPANVMKPNSMQKASDNFCTLNKLGWEVPNTKHNKDHEIQKKRVEP